MKTEIKKNLKTGFVLNEQELRRLSSTIKEQLKLAYPTSDTKISFVVKFKNGSISEPTTIDEIFAQENRGSEAIVQLTLKEAATQDENCAIEMTFSSDNENDSKVSISYHITHNDKDWVFVTNSKIDERVSRIKRWSVSRIMSDKGTASTITMVASMVGLFALLISFTPDQATQTSEIQHLAHLYAHDKYYSVIDFISKLEILKGEVTGTDKFKYFPVYIMIIFAAVFGATYAVSKIGEYLYPSYNFLWGDYVDLYQRRKNISYVVFVLILLGIAVAVIANIISGKLLHL